MEVKLGIAFEKLWRKVKIELVPPKLIPRCGRCSFTG